ncbi:hypothetical protein SBRY_70391 [Actinacidiphila bryophytorum]|uniref:Uncharacterized protein n=1 Tax=Actinacidiphila bryophytorum TaxID=1436133 RepID=A0A9W4H7G6_9ACTN|nr:hypothetical protein SBRY_70391 [Actinacidiphila bryophytorum]
MPYRRNWPNCPRPATRSWQPTSATSSPGSPPSTGPSWCCATWRAWTSAPRRSASGCGSAPSNPGCTAPGTPSGRRGPHDRRMADGRPRPRTPAARAGRGGTQRPCHRGGRGRAHRRGLAAGRRPGGGVRENRHGHGPGPGDQQGRRPRRGVRAQQVRPACPFQRGAAARLVLAAEPLPAGRHRGGRPRRRPHHGGLHRRAAAAGPRRPGAGRRTQRGAAQPRPARRPQPGAYGRGAVTANPGAPRVRRG